MTNLLTVTQVVPLMPAMKMSDCRYLSNSSIKLLDQLTLSHFPVMKTMPRM